MVLDGGGGGGTTTTTHSTAYTASTSTTRIVSCGGFGGLQVNAWRVGTATVVKAMCGSVQVWP